MGYHFNPDTGETGECKAKQDGCPFKGDHYATAAEASNGFAGYIASRDQVKPFATLRRDGALPSTALNTAAGALARLARGRLSRASTKGLFDLKSPLGNGRRGVGRARNATRGASSGKRGKSGPSRFEILNALFGKAGKR